MRKDLKFSADDPRVIACRDAVKKMGGFTKTARIFGITPQSVYKWEVVPKYWCLEVSRLTGIDIYTLRPDVYGMKKHRNGQRARGKTDVHANPTTAATTEMGQRAAPSSERYAGEGGDRLSRRAGIPPHPQSGARADISRPGNDIARLFQAAKNQPPTPAAILEENRSTSVAQCGYGGRSW